MSTLANDTREAVRKRLRADAPVAVLTYGDIQVVISLDGLDDALRRNTAAEALRRTVYCFYQAVDRHFGAELQADATNTELVFDEKREMERLANSLKYDLEAARAMKVAHVMTDGTPRRSTPEPKPKPESQEKTCGPATEVIKWMRKDNKAKVNVKVAIAINRLAKALGQERVFNTKFCIEAEMKDSPDSRVEETK